MNVYLVNKLFELGTNILDDKWNHIDQVFDLILDEFGYTSEERECNDVARDFIFNVMNGEMKQREAIKELAKLLKEMRNTNEQL